MDVETTTLTGELTLGHVLTAAGLAASDVVALRHTYTDTGLSSPEALTAATVLEYTRWQPAKNKLGAHPPRLWLVFMADGKRRSRLFTTYANHGEVPAERADETRLFDLRPTPTLSALAGRLVVEWSRDAVNWAKPGSSAATFPVVEIADPGRVPFPGFDRVRLSYAEIQLLITDSRYSDWRTALESVQGIYLIADKTNGKLYVGKADGQERMLGRWSSYARDGHGGNVALRALADLDPSHARHFQFSILRVFGPSVPGAEVDEAESHFKEALLTRQYGLNRN
ncbi:GIY-YIG nuclease family protein [Microlunatus spumicola]|uniref:GIY-YIG nuclease family protein n=1 Tax=Microlunatus spumicola TaxID=81499 RepID=A0ABP6X2L8_9ACTN